MSCSASDNSWYFAEDIATNRRQVVIPIPKCSIGDTKFGTLLFSDKFRYLTQAVHGTGFFRLDSDPNPCLMIRLDGFVNELIDAEIRIGFSFYRTATGGVFGIYVSMMSDSLKRALENECPFLEMLHGLDEVDTTVKLIQDAISQKEMTITLADESSSTSSWYDPATGESCEAVAPMGCYDINLQLSEECRSKLMGEMESLLEYHNSLPAYERDYYSSAQLIYDCMPMGTNPILPLDSHDAAPTKPSGEPVADSAGTHTFEPIKMPKPLGFWEKLFPFTRNAATREFKDLILNMDARFEGEARRLIEAGADINAAPSGGTTALIKAATMELEDVVRFLVFAGVNLDAVNASGETALMLAVITKSETVIRILAEAGANLEAADNKGKRAIHFAAMISNLPAAQALLSLGANVDVHDNEGATPLTTALLLQDTALLEVLIDAGTDVNQADDSGTTLLMAAAGLGDEQTVDLLMKKGASIAPANKDGSTALSMAIYDDHMQIARTLVNALKEQNEEIDCCQLLRICVLADKQETLSFLIEEGADVNGDLHNGTTPLMLAAYYGHSKISEILIEAGSDVSKKDKSGYDALLYAVLRGVPDVVSQLINAGAKACGNYKATYEEFSLSLLAINLLRLRAGIVRAATGKDTPEGLPPTTVPKDLHLKVAELAFESSSFRNMFWYSGAVGVARGAQPKNEKIDSELSEVIQNCSKLTHLEALTANLKFEGTLDMNALSESLSYSETLRFLKEAGCEYFYTY
ncbi:Phosphocholine transferase AnkX [Pontiella desulfatans]|uniref:Phosphocholine transferase AnkX n=1 Tax=Pontiella desulfatans TaxID=2750659 RepID=A0A6C2TWH3_PONDE|nr:ankyrin repeat domain-containing protein [Pontiella desulfatans]VGO12018.1 Phosphocholine transferase AnkX [Pontiella desulfatans]